MIDLQTPAAPGSLMRARMLMEPGKFRLARRDCELFSVEIMNAGSWGKLKIRTGAGREVFEQPSTFTGSFYLGGGCEGGLEIELYSASFGAAPHVLINWREPDRELI